MKLILGIASIAFLYGIADARGVGRLVGINAGSSAIDGVQYYQRRRWGRSVYRGRSGSDYHVGRGPYPDRITPRGVLTGPIPRSAKGGG